MITTAIQVIQVARFGPPEVLVPAAAPVPVPAAGQVAIIVAAADVLFLDTVIRSGRAAQWFPVRPPYVPGNGVAGTVTALGDGTDPAWAGRRVISRTGPGGGGGGYAEQVAVPAAGLVPVPDEVSLTDAAAVLHDGAAALGLLAGAAIKPGEWVLVLAAAGGMGTLLIQLARDRGARVIGAARGPAKLAAVAALGADAAVDYGQPDWVRQVTEATGGTGPDVVLDGAGGSLGQAAFAITAAGGRFSAHGAAAGGFAAIDRQDAARRGITVRDISQLQYGPADYAALAAEALAALAAGRIRPVFGQSAPLPDAVAAHAALEARAVTGRTVLLPGA
jgi:NADPH2:quinone reductase